MKGGKKNMENQNNLNSWDGFLGSNFLKAEDVNDLNQIFVCKNVELDTENNRPLLVLESEGVTSKFSLNVTNANFIKNVGIKNPKELIGKKIKFRIVQAYSPTSKKEVDSLRIVTVE
jgi:hypothetical protein